MKAAESNTDEKKLIIKECRSKEGNVCFAFDDRDRRGTAEIVQLPWNNNDAGVWILFSKVLTRRFFSNSSQLLVSMKLIGLRIYPHGLYLK